jgi:Flp pilus assembly protein TadG
MRRLPRNSKGQTTVELALCLPILCLFLFGIAEFGITFHNYLSLTDAVRAGARVAAVSKTSGQGAAAEAAVRDAADNLDDSKLDVETSSSWAAGSDVTVKATYPYEIALFGLPVYSGTLTSETTERVE